VEAAVRLTFRGIEVPGDAEPDESARLTPCARHIDDAIMAAIASRMVPKGIRL
jgi:hypothetical protein